MTERNDRFIVARARTEQELDYSRPASARGGRMAERRVKKQKRVFPETPERVLDAPGIIDDCRLNIIDWSGKNLVGVALSGSVYLWEGDTGNVTELMTLKDGSAYVSAVSFIRDGGSVAVGTSLGQVEIWDVEKRRRVRRMRGHTKRVPCLGWNRHLLASGCGDGGVMVSDVRVSDHCVSLTRPHSGEVSSIGWSADGRRLASAGEDGVVSLWEKQNTETPVHVIQEHGTRVSILAWCPWQPNLLCCGGYTDRTLSFWNANMAECVKRIDTDRETTAAVWSRSRREIFSAHGKSGCITPREYASGARLAKIEGHSGRVVSMATSPSGEFVVSASADESLRFWKCMSPPIKYIPEHIQLNSPLPKPGPMDSPFSKLKEKLL
ncbi:MAG: cell division cycle protein 20 [Amphiamblys sp. WSBS2006]|nr:MAG: cell division cycle protein 20 [Amphiamblys sp. WSBS2006]